MNDADLVGFPEMKEVTPEFGYFHRAYAWGNTLIVGNVGATWRIYTVDGYPLTRPSHHLTLSGFGTIESYLGASKVEYEIDDLVDDVKGLRTLIDARIKKALEKIEK